MLTMLVLAGNVFAAEENNDLIDAIDQINKEDQQKAQEKWEENLSFETFSSCEDLTTVMEDFIKENFKDNWMYRRGGFIEPMMMEDGEFAVMEMAADADDGASVAAPQALKSTA